MKPPPDRMGAFEDLVIQLGDAVTRKQMMASPTLMRDATMVACFDGEVLGVKLGRDTPELAEALALPGASLWHPGGGAKAFKDWAAIPYAEHDSWLGWVRAAIDLADQESVTRGATRP